MELCYCMLVAVIILYAQKWKVPSILTIEEWMEKAMEAGEITELTVSIREQNISFVSTWKQLRDLVLKTEK